MKVLFAHERYLPDSGGGGEVLVHQRAKFLSSRGIDVGVISAGDPGLESFEGIRTRRLRVHRRALPLAVPAFISAARDADLIHTFTYHAALPAYVAARLLRKPIVCEYAALFGESWSVMRPAVAAAGYRAVERLLLRLPFDGRVFLSEDSLQLARATGLSDKHMIVAPPGLEPRSFGSVDVGAKEDLVLFAGKFEKRKGIDDLLTVARACPEVRFAAVGWGPGAEPLAAAAPDNLQVIVDTNKVYWSMLDRARVFFFPSFAETFGIVVAEAMARSCAIISTSGHNFKGIHVEAGRTEAMVDAVRMLWHDRATSIAWGMENRERSRQYDWDTSNEAVLALYRTLVPEL
jgi:glycosyltransferase involved in cell wall biosynthesis